MNNNSPTYSTPIIVNYNFEKIQIFLFQLVSPENQLVGLIETPMNVIMGADDQTWTNGLADMTGQVLQQRGQIVVRVESMGESKVRKAVVENRTVGIEPSAGMRNPGASIPNGFVDYIRAGWEIGLSIAIDFTASNTNNNPSLHALGP